MSLDPVLSLLSLSSLSLLSLESCKSLDSSELNELSSLVDFVRFLQTNRKLKKNISDLNTRGIGSYICDQIWEISPCQLGLT